MSFCRDQIPLGVALLGIPVVFTNSGEGSCQVDALEPSVAAWPPLVGTERTWTGERSQSWFHVYSLNSFACFLCLMPCQCMMKNKLHGIWAQIVLLKILILAFISCTPWDIDLTSMKLMGVFFPSVKWEFKLIQGYFKDQK